MLPAAAQAPEALRILVVEDDPSFRRLMGRLLREPGIEVVASVDSIADAKSTLRVLPIDAVTLDVDLAGQSGLDLLAWIRQELPEVRVLLVSAGVLGAVDTELQAIFLGAVGFVRKPSETTGLAAFQKSLQGQLLPLPRGPGRRRNVVSVPPAVAALRRVPDVRPGEPRPPEGATPPSVGPQRAPREVIALGASTGGPPVLLKFLRALPASFDVPLLVVQHMGAEHMESFVAHLAQSSGRRVVLARHGDLVERGLVLVGPAGRHMKVIRTSRGLEVVLTQEPEEHHCRPAVDPLFRSVAEHVGARAVGVVLSGMGTDSAEGARAMHERGAPIVAQDRASSVVWGMPGAAVAAGAVDAVSPASSIADVVLSWTGRSAAP